MRFHDKPTLTPARSLGRPIERTEKSLEIAAWECGRSVHWTLVEPTRRVTKADPYNTSDVDGSYSPRSSWKGMYLSPEQLVAETVEIEAFVQKKPKDFQKACEGWDMRRRLEVDFASTDEYKGGEAIFVIACGFDEGQTAYVKRYTHCKFKDNAADEKGRNRGSGTTGAAGKSIFGGKASTAGLPPSWSFEPKRLNSVDQSNMSSQHDIVHEWRTSSFLFGDIKAPEVTSSAIDMSTYALLTSDEDPLLSIVRSSAASSPTSLTFDLDAIADIATRYPWTASPRLLAVGTNSGDVFIWNMRAPSAANNVLENEIKPVRVIQTDSPQVSCLALTALYLDHGGNDGLVQAWDLLASSMDPVRTLNSRFSSRARRRLVPSRSFPNGSWRQPFRCWRNLP